MAVELRLRELTELVREDRDRHYSWLGSFSSSAVWRTRTMRKIAPLCIGESFAITIPRLSVIIRSPFLTAAATVASHDSTACSAVADSATSTGFALTYIRTVSLIELPARFAPRWAR